MSSVVIWKCAHIVQFVDTVIIVVILQGKEFWLRYLLTYRSFSSHHDFIGRTAPALPHFSELVDWIFIQLHEIFVDGMYLDLNLLIDLMFKLCKFSCHVSCGFMQFLQYTKKWMIYLHLLFYVYAHCIYHLTLHISTPTILWRLSESEWFRIPTFPSELKCHWLSMEWSFMWKIICFHSSSPKSFPCRRLFGGNGWCACATTPWVPVSHCR